MKNDSGKKMLGPDAVQETEKVPMSESTINWCIDDMSQDDDEVLYDKVKKNNSFSNQVDELTDFTNKGHVMAFVRLHSPLLQICKICK